MRKFFNKVRGGKKSNYCILLGKFLVNMIDGKGGHHDLKVYNYGNQIIT